MEQSLDKRAVISLLARSQHGDLQAYVPQATAAVRADPEFYAHLVAWNHVKGQVRDARVALPVLALTERGSRARVENALAHLADLTPRDLARALRFAREVGAHGNLLRRLVVRYLRDLEAGPFARWEGVGLQHRAVLRGLYALYHVRPDAKSDRAIVKGQGGTLRFDVVRSVRQLAPASAAIVLMEAKVPFLVARGALGKAATDPDVLLALIGRMSPTELVTNMRWLEAAGVKRAPALRAALEERLAQAAKRPGRSQALKAARAAEALEDGAEGVLAGKLRALQERQVDRLGGIEGRWLVLGDRSPSMARSIEAAKEVAAILARTVRGQVSLVFFDSGPRYYDVTGKTYEDILALTRPVGIGSATSIGCGLALLAERGLEVDGIAVITDGEQNTRPSFPEAYRRYVQRLGNEPAVYYYQMTGGADRLSGELDAAGIDYARFDLRGPLDYASLPNIVLTMRAGKYGLLDELMGTPLRRLDEVLVHTKEQEVLRGIAREAAVAGS